MRRLLTLLLLIVFSSCTLPRTKQYETLLEPMVGTSKKAQVDRLLGAPTFCRPDGDRELCEYRTTAARNELVPDASRKMESMGPDLSPYDQFDVLHLFYDGFSTLKEWEPYVILQD